MTRSFTVTTHWKDGRASFVFIRFKTSDRPPLPASAVDAVQPGMTPSQVEAALGSPGLVRFRDSAILVDGSIKVSEEREWQVVDERGPSDRHLAVRFEYGRVTESSVERE